MKGYFSLLILILLFSSCIRRDPGANIYTEKIKALDTTKMANLNGEELAKVYCAMCHEYPEPSLLTEFVWRIGVLPNMGRRLGLKTGKNPYLGFSVKDVLAMDKARIYPTEPLISEAAWVSMEQFYLSNAPDTILIPDKKGRLKIGLDKFTVNPVDLDISGGSMVTYVGMNPFNQLIYVGYSSGELYMLDNLTMEIKNSITFPSPVVWINYINKNLIYLTSIGILFPNDQTEGKIFSMNSTLDTTLLISDLRRPVHTVVEDINQDGRDDLVICEYGNYAGILTWYEQTKTGDYQGHLLSNDTGAERVEVRDFNRDGKPDIMVLFAQGDERIVYFENKGNGNFSSERKLRFKPVAGSLYFDLADFNNDGFEDIIYVCGDNADRSWILKPYHGVFIYLNDGKNNFEEAFFEPINGAIKALPYDYDNDGDLDIAVAAFFPDFEGTPVEGFTYLENVSSSNELLNFEISTFEENALGRWLVMDRADIDLDNDMDLILGSFTFSVAPSPIKATHKMVNSGINLFYLENKLN